MMIVPFDETYNSDVIQSDKIFVLIWFGCLLLDAKQINRIAFRVEGSRIKFWGMRDETRDLGS